MYALYDVLLAMFCNEWTWVSLKKVQIERVEKNRKEDQGPVGVGRMMKRREMRCCQNNPFNWHAAFKLTITSLGMSLAQQIAELDDPTPVGMPLNSTIYQPRAHHISVRL